MVPFAAQDKAGKWGVEVSGWLVRPLSLDTTYAYGWYYNPVTHDSSQQPFSIGNEYRWQPNLKVSYSTDAFVFWADYTTYDQTSSSSANTGSEVNSNWITPTLNDPFLWGFRRADSATANLRTTYTNWDFNVGHVFHPTDKWALMVYGGLRYLRLENDLHVTYVDNYNQNHLGAGSTDYVRLHANMTGWGLNFGFTNDFTFGKRWALGTGLEVSMVRTTNDLDQYESFTYQSGNTTYTHGVTGIASSKQHVTPALKMYAEAKFNFNDSWYAKLGYRLDFIHDAFSFDYTTLAAFGGSFPTNKDVTFDGLYFTIGVKF
jgi:hypothetical protein